MTEVEKKTVEEFISAYKRGTKTTKKCLFLRIYPFTLLTPARQANKLSYMSIVCPQFLGPETKNGLHKKEN